MTLFSIPTFPLAALPDGMQLLAIAIAAVMGMGLVKLLDYLRKRDADKEAAQIIERAELEAKTIRKEAAIEAKELALQEKDRLERENNDIRSALHERERHLDKQEDTLNQRSEQLLKQEKMVENNQRRLAEKIEHIQPIDAFSAVGNIDGRRDRARSNPHSP